MNTKKQTVERRSRSDSAATRLLERLRAAFAPRRRRHDPMLVLSMSIFNFEGGWSRMLNPLKTHENGAR